MANNKIITHLWSETGKTVYCVIRREADGHLLNDADGAFANAPADPYVAMAEDGTLKGLYEKTEARTAWNNGKYTVIVYKQAGGSPAPASDTVIGSGQMDIVDDSEVLLAANADIAAIKAKTDNLPASPAAVGSEMLLTSAYDAAKVAASQASVDAIPTTPLLAADYTAPDNADITAIKAKTDNLPAAPATEAKQDLILGYIDEEVAAILAAVDTEVAAIKAKTDGLNFTGSFVQAQVKGQDNIDFGALQKTSLNAATPSVTVSDKTEFALTAAYDTAKTAASQASVDVIDGIVDDILADTSVIGASGAGLTAIPWNAAWDAEVQSECTDALNAYDPPTNAEMIARTLVAADYLVEGDTLAKVTLVETCTANTDMRGTDNAALASVCTEGRLAELDAANIPTDIAAVKGDTAAIKLETDAIPDVGAIADAVWDEAIIDHLDAGSTGAGLNAASSSGDPWATVLPGAYGASTAGKLIGDNINAPIATVDTVVDAIKAKTDNLPASPATEVKQDTIISYIDTEVAAIKAKTDNLPASPAAVGSEMTLTAAYDAAKTAATQASVNAIDTIVNKLDTTLVLDTDVYQFTANALELAPTSGDGGGATAEQIRVEMDTNSTKLANLDAAILTALAAIEDVPTVAEFNARTIPAANYPIKGEEVIADIKKVNSVPLAGTGTAVNPWRPA